MPSDLKKKKALKKKAAANAKDNKKSAATIENELNALANGTSNGAANGTNGVENGHIEHLAKTVGDIEISANHRACAGVLASHPDCRDVQLIGVTITFHGVELLSDTKLELNSGRRYGLLGMNGCGKSNLLEAIGNRELPIPEHIDIFHLKREMPPSDKTALQCVIEVDAERMSLEREAERLAVIESDEAQERLMDIYERLDEMGANEAEKNAAEILFGLGFSTEMQYTQVKDFSGGWRMRLALARALFLKPSMMLLDEPTNHLDLEACVWLEQYLSTYKRILIMNSHSQDFLNGVCTNIIHMSQQKLKYYGGNYDSFMQTRMELDENQGKRYRWEQDQIAHMKNYIARFGHGSAKLARQAQSKEKTLKRMVDGGLTDKVANDKCVSFYFPDCGTVPPPVIQVQNVSFRYHDDKPDIYRNLEFGFDLDTRIALVGPNGAGKSTLLKLIAGELHPTEGLIRRHSHLKMGRYHQHLAETLDMKMSSLEWMQKEYPNIKEIEDMRKIIGRYGLTGAQQTCPIGQLSDVQRSRVIFAWLAQQVPHMLLLDEPTNHLDMETIDALADAIKEFAGGLLLVSHDFRLIDQVADEIWICEHQKVTKWEGTIHDYKASIIQQLEKDRKKRERQERAANR
jgi:ATP-binding cassette subfamily F protein 2